ncbi:hypothetical protein GCM10009648_38920 [Tsukamurella spumae]
MVVPFLKESVDGWAADAGGAFDRGLVGGEWQSADHRVDLIADRVGGVLVLAPQTAELVEVCFGVLIHTQKCKAVDTQQQAA